MRRRGDRGMEHIDNGIPIKFAPHEMLNPALPEISEVQRLTLKPGDRIIVRTPQRLDMNTADYVERSVRARLQLPDDVPVLLLPDGMSLDVVNAALPRIDCEQEPEG